eukprot:290995_1
MALQFAAKRWAQYLAGGAAVMGLYSYQVYSNPLHAHGPAEVPFLEPKVDPKLNTYRRSEVEKHKDPKKSVWVTYRHGVYDITKFIANHPGGPERIKLAAGGSIEPFWHVYPQHKTQNVLGVLEGNRLGNLHKDDIEIKKDYLEHDPYKNDPVRHPAMRPNSIKPYCAECTPAVLSDTFYTPNELHYVRNHHPVPEVDPKKYTMTVMIDGKWKNKVHSLDDLKKKFKPRTVSCTLQCAGNRRTSYNYIRMTSLAQYDVSAISCAKWVGAPIRDVLMDAGLPGTMDEINKLGIKFAVFQALDMDPASGQMYQVSVPIQKVMDPNGDSILCYKMNGLDVHPDHGFPVRALHPGFIGFRNCKWCKSVRASKEELPFDDAPWQHSFYKVTPPRPDIPTFDFASLGQIYIWPVQSIFCNPMTGDSIEEGSDEIDTKGVAWSGIGRGIREVDVTANDGKIWYQAELEQLTDAEQPYFKKWAWTRWTCTVPLEKAVEKGDKIQLRVKAVDDAYNKQPNDITEIWNLRGCLNNSQHRIEVECE